MDDRDDQVWAELYPEFGSLPGFLDALRQANGDEPTRFMVHDASSGVIRAAAVSLITGGPRTAKVSISRKSHEFIVECADGPLQALGGMVETFPLVAQVLQDWMLEERSAVEMNTTPRLAVSKDDARRVFGCTVELFWWLPLQPFSWASDAHRAILEETKAIPELRQLAPILSMNNLFFSECTEPPYPLRAPWLRIISSGVDRPAAYEVRLGTRTFGPDRSTLLGTGDLDTAIALVRTHLPTDLRPAIVGDGYDLNPDVPRPPVHR